MPLTRHLGPAYQENSKMVNILVVDDEQDIRDVLRELLEQAGCAVQVASEGVEAITMFRNSTPDIVIIDIVMPGKDGVGVIKEIRKESNSVKIIAVSGGGKLQPARYKPEAIATTVYLAAADSAGANATLTKPFNKDDLLRVVRELS